MDKATGRALILAAGLGSRISGTHSLPKGFLKPGEETLIERSLRLLGRNGITDIYLVTGSGYNHYEELKKHFPFTTIHNADYAKTGSLYSYMVAARQVEPPFLLLESDILYEERSLSILQQCTMENAVLLSGRTNSGDEVYVSGHAGRIHAISKDPQKIEHLAGELTGISLIGKETHAAMIRYAESTFPAGRSEHYETDALNSLASTFPLYYLLVPDLIWCEIDDPAHLERARTKILPALRSKEKTP
ncbi:MAG: phosphocholine cytidylyltransferase family protein [Spirochaetales bacterium]|nr:phosphocholine cytidylyltransferase family protein [Spirochaetales bacterium]